MPRQNTYQVDITIQQKNDISNVFTGHLSGIIPFS